MDLFTADDVLDEAACRWIQVAMDAGVREPAAVLHDAIDVEVEGRHASDVEVGNDVVAFVESRLDGFREAIAAFYGLQLSDREGAGFLRYERGDFYGWHVDRADVPSWPDAGRRQITVVLFLNGSRDLARDGHFRGGTLRVSPADVDAPAVEIVPRRGLLVAFPATLRHEVTEVSEGRRDAIVDWFR